MAGGIRRSARHRSASARAPAAPAESRRRIYCVAVPRPNTPTIAQVIRPSIGTMYRRMITTKPIRNDRSPAAWRFRRGLAGERPADPTRHADLADHPPEKQRRPEERHDDQADDRHREQQRQRARPAAAPAGRRETSLNGLAASVSAHMLDGGVQSLIDEQRDQEHDARAPSTPSRCPGRSPGPRAARA